MTGDSPHEPVAVTGLGVVSPIGVGIESFWEALVAGRSGIRTVTRFDASALPVRIAGEVSASDREAREWVPELAEDPRADRCSAFAVTAAREALAQARIDPSAWDAERVGVYLGVAGGRSIEPCLAAHGADCLEWRGFGRTAIEHTDRHRLWHLSSHTVTWWVGQLCRAAGEGTTLMTACTAGTQAIGAALNAIRRGDVDVALAGGSSTMADPIALIGFSRLQALSTRNHDPAAASRPFDAGRDGFVIGEGAGILVLESLRYACRRGARPLALLAGFGASADAYRLTDSDPEGRGAIRAMQAALHQGGGRPNDIDYINAHGTSTAINDRVETAAVKTVFGEAARRIPISSNKSMIGHLIAAAGGVEAVATVLTIERAVIPPTINYATPDPECDLDYVPNRSRPARVRAALSNSFGFGGLNASLLLRQPHDNG